MEKYGYKKILDLDFKQAIKAVKESLKEQGFGIISEIDFKQKIKEKLDKDMDEYIILGACNPSLAFKMLNYEEEIGLFLPCNVIVYRKNNQTIVSTILPLVFESILNNSDIKHLLKDAELKLKLSIDNLG